MIDARTRDLVRISGGTFTMGSDHHYPEEAPAHPVRVDGFRLARRPVTNEEFAAFAADTGYITLAEQAPDPADYPDADPALLVAASSVFVPPPHPVRLNDAYQWWQWIPGADWRHPYGPESTVSSLADHPVVHIAYADAQAYVEWAGLRLPTEAEWEFAARGGLDGAPYAWGDELAPGGVRMANTWLGEFPLVSLTGQRTTPVGSFPANGYGLLDMIGNVWEWTSDYWAAHSAQPPSAQPPAPQPPAAQATAAPPAAVTPSCCGATSGTDEGPAAASLDPANPGSAIPRRVMKGGSHLCAPNYCRRYRPAARLAQAVDTSTSHLGFRPAL